MWLKKCLPSARAGHADCWHPRLDELTCAGQRQLAHSTVLAVRQMYTLSFSFFFFLKNHLHMI